MKKKGWKSGSLLLHYGPESGFKPIVLKDNRSKELEGAYEQEVQEQPLENIIRTEKMKLLYRMIDGLPGLQRDVVQLRDMEGLSYRDIAKTLQVTEEQVKVNLFRARKKIKTWILNMENYGLWSDHRVVG